MEWYSQGTSAAEARGDSCGKCERRKFERVGSEGKIDGSFARFTCMFVAVWDVASTPNAVVEGGGGKGCARGFGGIVVDA